MTDASDQPRLSSLDNTYDIKRNRPAIVVACFRCGEDIAPGAGVQGMVKLPSGGYVPAICHPFCPPRF